MNDAKFHLLRIVHLRIVEFLFIEKFGHIAFTFRFLIQNELAHVNDDFQGSYGAENDEEVEEEGDE